MFNIFDYDKDGVLSITNLLILIKSFPLNTRAALEIYK